MFSCKDCVAPKRHPGCHSTCPEYLKERAEYDKLKAIHDRERDINCGLITERSKKVYEAIKYKRKKKN